MATVYLPIIAPKDFEAFKRLLGAHLRGTYDAWCHVAEARSLQVIRGGHIVRVIEVDFHEFAVWLTAAPGRAIDLTSLDHFRLSQGFSRRRGVGS
jgi:hypothetical protein